MLFQIFRTAGVKNSAKTHNLFWPLSEPLSFAKTLINLRLSLRVFLKSTRGGFMKKAFLATTLLIASTTTSFASTQKLDAKWVISSIETTEVSSGSDTNGSRGGYNDYRDDEYYRKGYNGYGYRGGDVAGSEGGSTTAGTGTFNDRAEKVGTVIGIAKDIVALGEQIYELVKK
jgi:hypothetical protein